MKTELSIIRNNYIYLSSTTGSYLLRHLQEHPGDHRENGDQEREEGPGDELQRVDL